MQKLPSSAAIPQSEVIVPMRFDSGPDRPLYLVDTEGKIKQIKLPTPEGGNSNPIMQASRNTIIYANAGKLRVMASDGSGDRKLFNRDPAGCDSVVHASWSLTDPNVILITCEFSRNKFGLLVVAMDGRLIRGWMRKRPRSETPASHPTVRLFSTGRATTLIWRAVQSTRCP